LLIGRIDVFCLYTYIGRNNVFASCKNLFI